MASAAKSRGRSGGCAERQPASGAKPESDTAPGLGPAATQLRTVRASQGMTETTRLLAQGTAKVASGLMASSDAFAVDLGYAGGEYLLLLVLTWDPNTLMVCAVDVPERRTYELP